MRSQRRRKQLQRSRIKSTRGMRRLLACLGAVTLIVGAGLMLSCLVHHNRRLLLIGVVYCVAATAFFGLQRGVHVLERYVKRKHRRREVAP